MTKKAKEPARDLLPLRPWSFQQEGPGTGKDLGFVHVYDAQAAHVLTLWGHLDEKLALAKFICEAIRPSVVAVTPASDARSI